MKRTLVMVLALAIVVALGATLVSAQGRRGCGQRGAGGPGKCGMMGGQGQGMVPGGCPMMSGQGMGMGPGGRAMMGGQGMGMGPGGRGMMGGQGRGMGLGACMTNVQPQTPAQAQFVQQVRAVYDRIRAEQAELVNLQAANGNANRMAALQNDLAGLRTSLHELLWNNKPLMQQMGINCQMGPGACGPNAAKCAPCPNKDNCPCYANGTCTMDPAKCAQCPNKDNCPCYTNCQQSGACPANSQSPAPCMQNCPAVPTK